jgi:hypothetical protein
MHAAQFSKDSNWGMSVSFTNTAWKLIVTMLEHLLYVFYSFSLKGLSHEIDLNNFDKNLQN